jgi:probable HAF family extracellular repeat protein
MLPSTRRLLIISSLAPLLIGVGGGSAMALPAPVQDAAAPPTYDVVGVVEDGTNTPVGRGLNETGTIVGWSGYPLKAFRWDEGAFTALPGLAGDLHRVASDVNDAGVVVGHSGYETIEPPQHAVRWIDGVPEDLGTLPGDTTSHAEGLNETGTVVGSSSNGGDSHAFVWTEADGMIDITPTARLAQAYDVNESGQVAGYADARAFVWEDGQITYLGVPAGFAYSAAFAINDAGVVSAQVTSASGNTERAARWTPGVGWQVLGGIGEFAEPWGINNAGSVVGASGASFSSRHGFIYLDDWGFLWLNDLLTSSDWNVLDATDIDDQGRIVALAHSASLGKTTTVLLAPTGQSMQDKGLQVRLKGTPPSVGVANLRVVDSAGAPVAGALVKGTWSVDGQVVRAGDRDRTNRKGKAEIREALSGLSSGDVVEFCITSITHDGYTYDPSAPSCDDVTVP